MKFDVSIIGSGISGLSLAHFCSQKGLRVLLLDKQREPGGALSTQAFADGFWLELGAHTCYNSYGSLISLVKELGMEGELLLRRKLPYPAIRGKSFYPFLSQLSLLELARTIPSAFFLKREGKTVEEFFSAVVGKNNFKNTVQNAINAVICQDSREFPADLIFKKRKRNKSFPRSFAFKNGLSTIARKILENDKIEFRGGVEIDDIDELQTPLVGIAVDPQSASKLFKKSNVILSDHLALIKIACFTSFGISARTIDCRAPLMAGAIAMDQDFFSIVSRDVIYDDLHRGFSVHMKHQTDDLPKGVTDLLLKTGASYSELRSRTNIVPSLRRGHKEWCSKLDEILLRQSKRVMLTGNYFGGVSIEDCVRRSEKEVHEVISGVSL